MASKGIYFLVITVLLWGFTSPLIRLLQTSVSAESMLFYRTLFSLAFFLTFLLFFRRAELTLLAPRRMLQVLVASLFIMGTYLGLILAVENTTIADSVLLQQLSPLYVVLFSFFLLKERMGRYFLGAAALGIVGAVIILLEGYDLSSFGRNITGDFIAVLSGVLFAAYTVTSRYLSKSLSSSLQLTFWAFLLGSLMFSWAPFTGGNSLSSEGWTLLLLFGVFVTAVPLLTFNAALKRMPASRVSVFLLTLPAIHITYAYLLLGEVPSILSLLGGVLVLLSAFMVVKEEG